MKILILRTSALALLLAACTSTPTPVPDREAPTSTAPTAVPAATSTSIPSAAEPTSAPTAESIGAWSAAQRMIEPWRSEMPAVMLDGFVYVPGGFGGMDRLERYNPVGDQWEALAIMPGARHHNMSSAHGGQLYVFGGSDSPFGFSPTNTVWRYDPGEDTWSVLDPMPEARMSGAAVTLGDKIYLVGDARAGASLLEFSPSSGEWRTLPHGRHPRDHSNTVVFDGELWVLGGRGSAGEVAATEIFDPASETWREGPTLNIARAGFAAAVVQDKIMVAGGEVFAGGTRTLASVEIYDPDIGTWERGVNLPFPMHGFDGVGDDNGRFLVLGGSSLAGSIDNPGRVQIFTP